MNWLKRLLGLDRSTETPPPDRATAPAALPEFAFPLVAVRGAQAIKEWQRHQDLWRRDGASAVLLGDEKEVRRLAEAMGFHAQSVEAILQAAERQTAAEYFARRKAEHADDEMDPTEDEWPPEKVAPMELSAHLDILSRKPKPIVFLARIPTAKAWEIPAYLKFGDWNDCPAPEHQVTVMRHWAEQYLVEIYAVTGDVIECTVARPPRTREAALVLANEQFLYCTDIVYQGTESISMLGATLLDSKAWYFWWD